MSRHSDGLYIGIFLFAMTALAGWLTHVVWIIRKLAGDNGATVGQMVLGAIGAIVPPVGTLHGWLMWIGVA